MATFCMWSC